MASIISIYKLECIKEKSSKYDVSKKISNPSDAIMVFEQVFNLTRQSEEVLVMFALNTKNMIIGAMEVSRGSLNSSIVHPREVFKRALTMNASSIILSHNHPSGDPTPSQEDINITRRLIECGKLLGIDVVDHIVFGGINDYGAYKFKSLVELI